MYLLFFNVLILFSQKFVFLWKVSSTFIHVSPLTWISHKTSLLNFSCIIFLWQRSRLLNLKWKCHIISSICEFSGNLTHKNLICCFDHLITTGIIERYISMLALCIIISIIIYIALYYHLWAGLLIPQTTNSLMLFIKFIANSVWTQFMHFVKISPHIFIIWSFKPMLIFFW